MASPEPVRDPEEFETQNLLEMARLKGVSVLEIGSGDGRLTWRYAGYAGRVTTIDVDTDGLAAAYGTCPPGLAGRVGIVEAAGEALPFREGSFDMALLAWSL